MIEYKKNHIPLEWWDSIVRENRTVDFVFDCNRDWKHWKKQLLELKRMTSN